MPTTKTINLRPMTREVRAAMREAHDDGRHGDGSAADVVTYWAETCADCHAVWRYEVSDA